ncbi:MAG: hypothetical protein GY865_13325 [candidate division Zixibacteria bacterium]|nr:hypothetical protein [candidate division Zixibacteria bacterium]
MIRSRTDRILNMVSSTLVLLAGFYVIIFFPLRLPGLVRVIIGILLVIYFLWRIRYAYGSKMKTDDVLGRENSDNKPLDNQVN